MTQALTHSLTWHADQAATERAWLDQWARAERTPECPWARPDWDVMGDWTSFLRAARTATGS
ncbi:hypothetical protein ACWEGQ_00110 [Streptomyces seoulensis]